MSRRDRDAEIEIVAQRAAEQAVAMLEEYYSSNGEQAVGRVERIVAVHEIIMKITTSF